MVDSGRRRFDQEIQALSDPENPDAHTILPFIRRSLKQFHLDDRFDVYDILNETYLRAVKLMTTGTEIRSPLAWVRKTAFNVIREISREQKRYLLIDPDQVESELVVEAIWEYLIPEDSLDANCETVMSALQALGLRDRELLNLRFVEGLTWREIGERLAVNGEPLQNDAALRQQGHRALKRLRDRYHSYTVRFPEKEV